MCEILKRTKQIKQIHIHRFEDNIISISVLPNLIYRFTAILVNTLGSYFINIHKLILIFIGKGKKHTTVNNTEILKMEN